MKNQLKYYIPTNNLFLENQFISNHDQGFSYFGEYIEEVRENKIKL